MGLEQELEQQLSAAVERLEHDIELLGPETKMQYRIKCAGSGRPEGRSIPALIYKLEAGLEQVDAEAVMACAMLAGYTRTCQNDINTYLREQKLDFCFSVNTSRRPFSGILPIARMEEVIGVTNLSPSNQRARSAKRYLDTLVDSYRQDAKGLIERVSTLQRIQKGTYEELIRLTTIDPVLETATYKALLFISDQTTNSVVCFAADYSAQKDPRHRQVKYLGQNMIEGEQISSEEREAIWGRAAREESNAYIIRNPSSKVRSEDLATFVFHVLKHRHDVQDAARCLSLAVYMRSVMHLRCKEFLLSNYIRPGIDVTEVAMTPELETRKKNPWLSDSGQINTWRLAGQQDPN